MANVPVIETLDLSKSYGHFVAVRELTLSVARHRITAFVGLNGAGKSTTLKMLLGIIRPDSGSGKVLGRTITDPRASLELRRDVAYVSEHKALYEYMTVDQMIRFTSAFYADWRSDSEQQLVKQYRLPRSALIKTLSKGMRTKLHLLLAFARSPALLILDEPTDGLDPIGIEELLGSIIAAREQGTTVFFSSHQLADVERIADHICMIHDGQLVLDASLASLQQYRQLDFVFPYEPKSSDLIMPGVESFHIDGQRLSVVLSGNTDNFVQRARHLNGAVMKEASVGLREVFLGKAKGDTSALV